jgi:hypothetical protein
MALSEELAMFHMELLIGRRRQAGGFVKHTCGCRVDCSIQNQKYREMLASSFDYAVLPMPWKLLQPREGEFDTEQKHSIRALLREIGEYLERNY